MRIKDLPEATALAEDDYLVMASEGGGACKIKAKLFEPVVVSIDAVYTQTETVYDDTPLDDLKTDLVVTAYFEGGGSRVIDNYTLSGTLEIGSSVITVTYKGKTDTIIVEVSQDIEYLYKWDFTKSLTDEVQGVTATLVNQASRDSTGVHFLHALDAMNMSPNPINMNGKTIEIDIASFVFAGQNNSHVRFIMNMPSNTERGNGTGMLIRKYQDLRWNAYLPNSQATSTGWGSSWNIQDSDLNGHTLKMSCENDNKLSMWIDDQLVDTKQGDYTYLNSTNCNYLRIGGLGESKGYGDQCYNMTITGIRIYNNQ